MQTETLDICTRNYLINKQMSLHYYLPALHRGIKALDELAKDCNFGPNVKQLECNVSVDRFSYPNDCTSIVSVFGLVGGEEKKFLYNPNITTIKKMVSAVNVVYTDTDTTLTDNETERGNFIKDTTMADELPRMMNINYPEYRYQYNVDLTTKEVVLAHGSEVTKAYIRYVSSYTSKTSTNTVPLIAESAVHAYIEWQESRNNGSPQSKVALLREEYFNEKRNLVARLNPLSLSDILQMYYFN